MDHATPSLAKPSTTASPAEASLRRWMDLRTGAPTGSLPVLPAADDDPDPVPDRAHAVLVAVLLVLWLSAPLAVAEDGAGAAPLPPLPPEPRTLQLAPAQSGNAKPMPERSALATEIEALRQAVARVDAVLAGGTALPATASHGGTEPSAAEHLDTPRRQSPAYGEQLVMQSGPASEGEPEGLVHSALTNQPAEALVRELAQLADLPLEDTSAVGLRRPVDLQVDDLPWGDALDRILGQVGLTWRLEGRGATRRLLIVPGATEGTEAEEAGRRALERAARGGATPVAAEAKYRLARRELTAHRPVEAMHRFNAMVEDLSRSNDPQVRRWVQRAVRAIGDCMMELEQWQEARAVYRNYLARAEVDDPDLPEVYLQAAEAGRRYGVEHHDPVVLDEAMDDLHTLLERFGKDPDRPEVPLARLLVGGLLVDAGRWAEAATQLALYAESTGEHPSDQVRAWLATCDFELGRYEAARARFEELHRIAVSGTRDAKTPAAVYERAAFQVGQCHLKADPPRYVHALFAFQRARTDFPSSTLTPELLVNIARCYAEIEREDEAVATLTELLKGDGATTAKDAQDRLDLLMGSLAGRLGEYPGPVRARVLFYIAQASHRRAERDRTERRTLAAQSIGWYERTLQEDPPVELRDAARVGLARAALLAGDEQRGVLELGNLLKDVTLGDRDRAYAARLLGDHYRATGKLREAMKAYRGEL